MLDADCMQQDYNLDVCTSFTEGEVTLTMYWRCAMLWTILTSVVYIILEENEIYTFLHLNDSIKRI